jgi:hypothetical protein
MRVSECRSSSYEVVVLGELGAPVLAFCTRPPTHNETSGVFQLRVGGGQGIADVAATLQAAGLKILSIRRVSEREAWAVGRVLAAAHPERVMTPATSYGNVAHKQDMGPRGSL